MRFASALLAALVLAACAPVVVQIADGPLEGPQLAIQVANASDREVAVGYEFEAGNSGGVAREPSRPASRSRYRSARSQASTGS